MDKIINECAERTRSLISQYADKIEALSNELLEKETLDLLDIIRIIGERPFDMSESMKDYMKEIENRKQNKPKEKKEDEEDKNDNDDKDKKSDEFEKDKDLKGNDNGGTHVPPRDPQEKQIQDAETIMK